MSSSISSNSARPNHSSLVDNALISNAPLLENDRGVIRKLMAKKAHELKSMDADILQFRKALNDLEDHRQDILSDCRALKMVIAPHRHIPCEILERIFRFCDYPPIHLPPILTRLQNIWAIIQVCSRWREIAIADPILWGKIEIQRSWTDPEGALMALENRVHDIFINKGSQGIVEYRTRVADNEEWEYVLSLMRTYPSRLQKIDIQFSWSYQTDDVLLSAPSTRIREPAQSNRPPSIDTALQISNTWNHITHIMMDSITIPGLCRILCHCNRLADLKVIFKNSDMLYNAPHGLIKLGSLESVLVKQDNNVKISEFLDALILPSLKHLHFGYLTLWPQESVLALLARSECTLETFDTNQAYIPSDDILQLRKAIPGLTTLETRTRHLSREQPCYNVILVGR